MFQNDSYLLKTTQHEIILQVKCFTEDDKDYFK